jgi:ABC-2 type transport system ATP-binding protein
MPNPIIHTKALTKDFKKIRAVNNLDIEIQPGELFGLVGPDGAGKTTTLRLLAGLLDITEGDATILGYSLSKDAEIVKPFIGYMAQQFSLYAKLSVIENLIFFADLFDVEKNLIKDRMERLLNFAGLTQFKHRRAANLSGGMQKKLALACTLIHEPPILLLDEPTTGVDPVSRREFWNILNELHIEGTTILVSTPYMDEADRCSIVGLMYDGKLVTCKPPKMIKKNIKGELIELFSKDWQTITQQVENHPGILDIQAYGEALHIFVDSSDIRLPQIEESLKNQGIDYSGARTVPARMEEAFISLIRQIEIGKETNNSQLHN